MQAYMANPPIYTLPTYSSSMRNCGSRRRRQQRWTLRFKPSQTIFRNRCVRAIVVRYATFRLGLNVRADRTLALSSRWNL